MNECGFWFWFVRPAAEFMGAIALVAGLVLAAWVVLFAIPHAIRKVRK